VVAEIADTMVVSVRALFYGTAFSEAGRRGAISGGRDDGFDDQGRRVLPVYMVTLNPEPGQDGRAT